MIMHCERAVEELRLEGIKFLPSSVRREFEKKYHYEFTRVVKWAEKKDCLSRFVASSRMGKHGLRPCGLRGHNIFAKQGQGARTSNREFGKACIAQPLAAVYKRLEEWLCNEREHGHEDRIKTVTQRLLYELEYESDQQLVLIRSLSALRVARQAMKSEDSDSPWPLVDSESESEDKAMAQAPVGKDKLGATQPHRRRPSTRPMSERKTTQRHCNKYRRWAATQGLELESNDSQDSSSVTVSDSDDENRGEARLPPTSLAEMRNRVDEFIAKIKDAKLGPVKKEEAKAESKVYETH